MLCSDVDECKTSNGSCPENSKCVNTLGSFECQCQRGYEKINGSCKGNFTTLVISVVLMILKKILNHITAVVVT